MIGTIGTIATLKTYQERCFINALLFEGMMNHNIFVRNLFNFPLIIISGILTILNSIIEDQNDMKICNIILNGTVALILSISNSLKINDKITTFKNVKNKIIKLQHKIDNYLNTRGDIDVKDVEEIITSYDLIIEEVEYPILDFIKTRIKKKYKHMSMPLSMMATDDCSAELCCDARSSSEGTNEPNTPTIVIS